MSIAIYVYKAGSDLRSKTEPPLKTLIYPQTGADDDDARLLGEDIVNLVDEFDGLDLDMVLEFRADPDAQRSFKDGIFR